LEGEVGFGTVMTAFIGRGAIIAVGECILTLEKSLKGVGPKFDRQIGTGKHATEGISNGLMCAFDGSVLIVSVSASWEDFITVFVKEGSDFWVSVKLTTLIKVNVLVFCVGGGVATEPGIKPGERSSLGNACGTIQSGSGMVSQEDPTCFTVEAFIVFGASSVLGLLASEGEIDGNTLPRDSGAASEFFGKTGRAVIEYGIRLDELGHALYMLMGIVQVGVATMVKALVPK
jgi:hypothetical protein